MNYIQKLSARSTDSMIKVNFECSLIPEEGLCCQLEVFLHDDIDISWYATTPVVLSNGKWESQVPISNHGGNRLLEVRLAFGQCSSPMSVLDSSSLLLESDSSLDWITGNEAEAERSRLESARHASMVAEIRDTHSQSTDPMFFVLMVADNILLTQHQYVPGISFSPIQESTIGSDLLEVLNAMLQQHGFTSAIESSRWLEQTRSRHPTIVIIAPNIRAADTNAAFELARAKILPILHLLALKRGSSPRLLGGAIGNNCRTIRYGCLGFGRKGEVILGI